MSKIKDVLLKGERDVKTYSEEWILGEYNRIYRRFCWNLKIYAHVKNGADVYVSSKRCCEDLYNRLYAVGQVTRSYCGKIESKIEKTYHRFLEDGVIIED